MKTSFPTLKNSQMFFVTNKKGFAENKNQKLGDSASKNCEQFDISFYLTLFAHTL